MIKQLQGPARFRVAVVLAAIAALAVPLTASVPNAAAALSRPAMSGRPAAAAPECPRADNGYCYVDVHFDTVITYCPSFGRDSGNCVGKSTGTRDFSDSKYSTGGLPWYTSFSWDGVTKRIVTYQVQISGIVRSMITGEVPGPGSADFRVSSAYTTDDPAAQFRTENLPGKKAGEVGGPLYLNFENGTIGADVYIHGYLKRV